MALRSTRGSLVVVFGDPHSLACLTVLLKRSSWSYYERSRFELFYPLLTPLDLISLHHHHVVKHGTGLHMRSIRGFLFHGLSTPSRRRRRRSLVKPAMEDISILITSCDWKYIDPFDPFHAIKRGAYERIQLHNICVVVTESLQPDRRL